jgi:hypothetical protein
MQYTQTQLLKGQQERKNKETGERKKETMAIDMHHGQAM